MALTSHEANDIVANSETATTGGRTRNLLRTIISGRCSLLELEAGIESYVSRCEKKMDELDDDQACSS